MILSNPIVTVFPVTQVNVFGPLFHLSLGFDKNLSVSTFTTTLLISVLQVALVI